MHNEIEKKNKINIISPKINRNSSPILKIFFKNKEPKKDKNNKRKEESLLIKETDVLNLNISFQKKMNKKRNHSCDYNDKHKKRILKKVKDKLFKESNERLAINNNTSIDELEKFNESKNYFSFSPHSNFIFIFDLLLIFANLYTFIVIPLNIAKNQDIRKKGSLVQEIMHIAIDILFFLDFIFSIFRGYYDYEMNLIRNNKKIIINYLKTDFLFDFIQAIPFYSLNIILFKSENKLFFVYSQMEYVLISILILVKPFKIFKIIDKRKNKALEDFFLYLSENFYLEQLAIFLIYFLIFFLFLHLFICLHLYFSLQSYPSWITHTNLINESLIQKYVASLYFMITTMTTVGYGDIICISFIERIYHIILLFLGTLLYTFLVSKISNIWQMKVMNKLN